MWLQGDPTSLLFIPFHVLSWLNPHLSCFLLVTLATQLSNCLTSLQPFLMRHHLHQCYYHHHCHCHHHHHLAVTSITCTVHLVSLTITYISYIIWIINIITKSSRRYTKISEGRNHTPSLRQHCHSLLMGQVQDLPHQNDCQAVFSIVVHRTMTEICCYTQKTGSITESTTACVSELCCPSHGFANQTV